jgi:hypothetical protein
MVFGGGQLAPQFQQADIRGILVTRAVGRKGFVGNAQRVLASFGVFGTHGECIFPEKSLGLKADVLHDKAIHQDGTRLMLRTACLIQRAKREAGRLCRPACSPGLEAGYV